ncbi:HNH endonuclease family protein, partial [Escherichia coli]
CISDTLVPTTYLVDTTLSNSSDSDQTVQAVRLPLLNLSVNRSVQNAVFLKKRDALIVHTNLRLNIPLIVKDKWDEDEILERGKKLGEIALKVWPKHD